MNSLQYLDMPFWNKGISEVSNQKLILMIQWCKQPGLDTRCSQLVAAASNFVSFLKYQVFSNGPIYMYICK